jgi:hypothetical protein
MILPGGVADQAGLENFHVLRSVGNTPIRDFAHAKSLLNEWEWPAITLAVEKYLPSREWKKITIVWNENPVITPLDTPQAHGAHSSPAQP